MLKWLIGSSSPTIWKIMLKSKWIDRFPKDSSKTMQK